MPTKTETFTENLKKLLREWDKELERSIPNLRGEHTDLIQTELKEIADRWGTKLDKLVEELENNSLAAQLLTDRDIKTERKLYNNIRRKQEQQGKRTTYD